VFHVLSKGEIEDYLIDTRAMAAPVNHSQNEVDEVLTQTKGRGKARLDNVLKRLGVSKASAEVKELLALHLQMLDLEILGIVEYVSSRLGISKQA
jgi:hypothetical protein